MKGRVITKKEKGFILNWVKLIILR